METKKELRKEVLKIRDALSLLERKEKSQEITKKVTSFSSFCNSDKVLLFASYKSEVETKQMIEQAFVMGKHVYLPKVKGEIMEFYRVFPDMKLKDGYFGIQEPKEDISLKLIPQKEENIFVLLPGAVFDEEGGRIGYGKGFYDKFLQELEQQVHRNNICKMAVAFECQIVEKGRIIREEHDILPNVIVTEERMIKI
ncbi:MAG: 5-formyltetrahydrofolate cyclo-ligase [Lachnospiraceae bacterium]|nr:5-formyltetrahydrofolate cyclo-ligase [Lachnospiraceae bacterium]